MDNIERFSVIQNQPFCWQTKAARRFIREIKDKKDRKSVGGMLAVYTALTEMASDEKTSGGTWDQPLIAKYAGLSVPTVRKCLQLLDKYAVIVLKPNRDARGHKRPFTIWLPDHAETKEFPKEISFEREPKPKEISFERERPSTTGGVPATPGAEPKEKNLHALFFQHIELYKPLKDKSNLSKGGQVQQEERAASLKVNFPKAFPVEFRERWQVKYSRFGIPYVMSVRDNEAFPTFELTWVKLADKLKPWIIKAYLQNDFKGWVKQFHPFWGLAEHLMRFTAEGEQLMIKQEKIDNALNQPASAPPPEMPVEYTREQVDKAPKWLRDQIDKYGGVIRE